MEGYFHSIKSFQEWAWAELGSCRLSTKVALAPGAHGQAARLAGWKAAALLCSLGENRSPALCGSCCSSHSRRCGVPKQPHSQRQSQGAPSDNLLQACPSHVLCVMPLLFDLLCLQQRRRSKKSWALPLISALLHLFFPFFFLFLTIAEEVRQEDLLCTNPRLLQPQPRVARRILHCSLKQLTSENC